MNRHILMIAVVALMSTAMAGTNPIPLATCTEHNISLTIQPSTRSAVITDSGQATCAAGWNLLYLAKGASIAGFTLDGSPATYQLVNASNPTGLKPELKDGIQGLEVDSSLSLLFFRGKGNGTVSFRIAYSAQFEDPVENVQFSREKVGNEVRGTILERGAYLSSAAGFYPQGMETMARFSLTSSVPAHWTAIADGNPVTNEIQGATRVQHFSNPYLSDGYVFMAAPFAVKVSKVEEIVVATYFFPEDSSLCDKYLTATVDYIKMYQDLIGPYPFNQFTVAENFFPTGYGMPGWTLLGQSVLRLPFIITSSLGHEVLHNWWGNSVYVDYTRGNWCEAATVYGADYRYKLLSSEADAKGYRKDILKEYLSYVNAGNDFPLREFKSRSSAETRTIGYNKGMMLFHLIEQQIGTTAFFDAWKQVYRDYKGKAISWEEWIAAFEKTSGQNLSHFIPEWVDRAGAPEIGLEVLSVTPAAAGKRTAKVKLTQSTASPYHLTLPLVITANTYSDTIQASISGPETTLDLVIPETSVSLTVDPDYHLFRKLYPEEVEPIISAVLGTEKLGFISCSAPGGATDTFVGFAGAIAEDSVNIVSSEQLSTVSTDHALVLFDPVTLPSYIDGMVKLNGDSVAIGGAIYALQGHTFIMAGQHWNGYAKYLVALSGDSQSLPRIGQLVPHYGKYSYLVFEGAKNIAKGQWPVTDSPLRKVIP